MSDVNIRKALGSLKVDELKDICRNYGISGYSSLKKAEIVTLIIKTLNPNNLDDILKKNQMIPEESVPYEEIKDTIETGRVIDNQEYLNLLLQSLTTDDLKQICRDFSIRGYSKYKKLELIEFILDSLAIEEQAKLLYDKELEIISDGIETALNKIRGEDRETLKYIRIANEEKHDIELHFSGMGWEINTFLSINEGNIENPMRDCECRVGGNMGFCSHFWVGFIFSLKRGFFELKHWSLTRLPENFEKNIDSVEIEEISIDKDEKTEEAYILVDVSTDDYELAAFEGKAITVYEGEIDSIERKTQVFQEITTIYYMLELKGVKIGPRVKKKSDFKEENIFTIDFLTLRASQNLMEAEEENDESTPLEEIELEFHKGDVLKFNGRLDYDNFLKMYVIKNVRKIEIV